METGFVPAGDARLRQILDAVLVDGDAVEAHYLEVKSDIDLASPIGLAKVVKFILGAANRPTAMAAAHFEGRAVMVLGAGEDVALGVAKGVESHVLADRAARYLGAGGPGFELGRLSVSAEREVLFVVVDAPRAGQPLYPCHANYNPSERADQKYSLSDGAVYVRMGSATRPAKAAELLAMVARAGEVAGVGPIDFRVDVEAPPVYLVGVDGVRDAWVAGEKARFLDRSAAALEQWEQEQRSGSRPRGFSMAPTTEEAERLADEWEERFVGGWPRRAEVLAGVGVGGLVLRVVNEASSYLREVRVEVTFHGCRAVSWHDVMFVDVVEVFEPVAPVSGYGSWAEPEPRRSKTEVDEEIRAILAAKAVDEEMAHVVSWRQEGPDLVVALALQAVRPQTPWRMAGREVVVLVEESEATSVRVSWAMTAEGRSERAVGEMAVAVVDVDAADAARFAWARLRRHHGPVEHGEPVDWLPAPGADRAGAEG